MNSRDRAWRSLSRHPMMVMIAMGVWLATACSQGVGYQRQTQPVASVVALPPAVKTVDGVMSTGSFLTWLDEGLRLTDAGHFEAALPYLEAAVESRQAWGVQKIILYWAAAQVHAEVGFQSKEVVYLELFLLSTSGLEDDPIFEDVDLGRWVRYARARLLALRVMRGGGYGTSMDDVIMVEAVEEEVLLLEQLRCGPKLKDRVSVHKATIEVIERRVIERLDLICDEGDPTPWTLFFDLTQHTPAPVFEEDASK